MTELKSYIQQLLQKYRIDVAINHLPLIDAFADNETAIEAYSQIKNAQKAMLDKWKEQTQIEDIKSRQIVLSNGTVNKPYEFVLNFEQLKFTDIIGDYNIEAYEKAGITFSKEENKISGIPKEAGEHILLFNFKLKNEGQEKPFHTKEIKLIINPDPKSLWKNEPTPTDIEYYKPDNVSASFDFDAKKLIVGSKRGRSHAHEAKPRDDAFEFLYHEETGWGIIAVADGAGSVKFSRKGSEIACETVVEYFKNVDKEKLKEIETTIADVLQEATEENKRKLSSHFIEQLGNAAFAAQKNIREEAIKKEREIRDYSTTIIFALIKRYENKFVIASFWVGDGGIGIYNKGSNEVFVLGTPDSGEFAGQTRFLTMSDIFAGGAYANRVRFKIVEDFTALILMTDGITDAKFQTDANLNKIEKWNEFWEDLNGNNQDNRKVGFSKPIEETEQDLMMWLDFWSAGNHDDRTIAILY
ncbi:MAG: protein phosphatase 2C domain-containing protein [Chitinophagaceae bacterium]|nr:protein phosphatase 2C domain-containing protein [Chitinophagaceae bacterium]